MHNDHCVGHGVLFVKTLSVYTAISSLSFLKFGREKKKGMKVIDFILCFTRFICLIQATFLIPSPLFLVLVGKVSLSNNKLAVIQKKGSPQVSKST